MYKFNHYIIVYYCKILETAYQESFLFNYVPQNHEIQGCLQKTKLTSALFWKILSDIYN